jgi:hypothetical protein
MICLDGKDKEKSEKGKGGRIGRTDEPFRFEGIGH